MQKIQTIGIIRARGQLTIPDDIREAREWVSPQAVVTIVSERPDEIIIKPHQAKKEVDWDKLWKDFKRVRSYKGKWHGSLSKFIVRDRERY